jgi:hypothetical protein
MAQWSLRTLLVATAVVPVAILAIFKATALYVSAVLTLAVIAWIAVAIMAWIDTGSRQAWARGVILAATAYGLLVVWMGTEFELVGSKLATSGVLYYAHVWAVPTGSEPIESVPLTFTSPDGSQITFGNSININSPISVNSANGLSATFQSLSVWTNTSPTRRDFATIGHVYWGMLLGLVGGWFAAWIERRKREEPSHAMVS